VRRSDADLEELEATMDRDRRQTLGVGTIAEDTAGIAPAVGSVIGRYTTAVIPAGTDLAEGKDLRSCGEICRRRFSGGRAIFSAAQRGSDEHGRKHRTDTRIHGVRLLIEYHLPYVRPLKCESRVTAIPA
jgi:hypothetical protein